MRSPAMKVVFARTTCTVTRPSGPPVTIHIGEIWAADDPFVRERPELFQAEPLAARRTVEVEQATRAPGERRSGVSRR
jgi:hypothetical protein